jgi:hypothetical protein
MITKRIIPCLDVKNGRVVKGVNFEGLNDVSSPVSLAKYYSDNGADELVFYDITASSEGRKLFTEVLKDEFASAFDQADHVTFMDVYPAGEMPLPGVNGGTFMQVVLDHEGHPADTVYVERRQEVAPHLADALHDGDLLITMGAGDVTAIGPEVLRLLEARENGETR